MHSRMVASRIVSADSTAGLIVQVDNTGKVFDVRFPPGSTLNDRHSCIGRSFREMPQAVREFCFQETVSHQLCAAKAADSLLAIRIPHSAASWRRMLHFGHLVQSHASQIMSCAGCIDAVARGVGDSCQQQLQTFAHSSEFLCASLRLRHAGGRLVNLLDGAGIVGGNLIAGGIRTPFTNHQQQDILRMLPVAFDAVQWLLADFKRAAYAWRPRHLRPEQPTFLYVGMVSPLGDLEHYDGRLRIVHANGTVVGDQLEPETVDSQFGEVLESESARSSLCPDLREIYRVGPLARLRATSFCGTPLADAELGEFRRWIEDSDEHPLHGFAARLIEILYSLERVHRLVLDSATVSNRPRYIAALNENEGFGCVEAPSGTIFHRYWVNDAGILLRVNIRNATEPLNPIDRQRFHWLAETYIHDGRLDNVTLDRLLAAIQESEADSALHLRPPAKTSIRVEIVGPDGSVQKVRSYPGASNTRDKS